MLLSSVARGTVPNKKTADLKNPLRRALPCFAGGAPMHRGDPWGPALTLALLQVARSSWLSPIPSLQSALLVS